MCAGTDSEQIRPALAGVKVAGSAFDAGVKPAGSFRLRGAMQCADHAPIGDRRILGGAQSSAVRSKRIAAVGMMTSPILDSRIRLPHDPTRMKIRAPLWTASGSTMPIEGPPIPEVVTEMSISRYFPVCETSPRASLEKRRDALQILLGDHIRAARCAHDQAHRRQIVRARVGVIAARHRPLWGYPHDFLDHPSGS